MEKRYLEILSKREGLRRRRDRETGSGRQGVAMQMFSGRILFSSFTSPLAVRN